MMHAMTPRRLILLMICASQLASQEIVTSVSYALTQQSAREDELLHIARMLVKVRPNQPLDTILLNESIAALQVCRMFENVAVEHARGRVIFFLTPAQYIRDFHIVGEFPLFEDDIERAMSVSPGDVFHCDALVRQDSLITALYQREGFVSPQVEVTARTHRSGNGRVVHVQVHAGKYYRIQSLIIEGNRAMSDFQIKRRMKVWRASLIPASAGRFVEADLREDIKTITEFYRSNGFADVAVRETVIADSAARLARIVLSINEGHRYRVRFSSWRERGFSATVLREDAAFLKTGNRNNLGIRKAVKAIEKRMRKGGYLAARVEVADTTIERRRLSERRVRFSIHKGQRTTVASIKFTGVVNLDEKLLRQQMLHVDKGSAARRAYDPEKLQEDVFAIQSLYRSRGFLKATVASTVTLQGESATITIDVEEGKRTIICTVSVDVTRFTGIDASKAITVRKGDFYRNDLLRRDARVLQAMIAEKGYPHVTVNPVVSMNSDSSSANVEFRIDEGPMVTLGDVRYVGAFRTREKVLRRELRALPGKPLSLKKIVESQKRLRDLGLFGSVRFNLIGLREKWDTIPVFVELVEKRPYYGTMSAGYQSDQGPFVHAKAGDRNLFGYNKEGWVSAGVSEIGYDGRAGLVDPRLFGWPLRVLAEIFGERKSELNLSWENTRYGLSVGLSASPNKRLALGLATGYERCRLSYKTGAAPAVFDAIPDEERPRNRIVTTPSLVWDRRDSFTRPRKGALISVSVDMSKSIGSALDDFVKAQLESKGYVTPWSWLTFAAVARGGYLRPYGGMPTVPANQRFYLGGAGDVRGFAENLFHQADSTGGLTSFSASIEARIEIALHFELAAFVDIGRLEDDFQSITLNQFRLSTGLGARYITPVGPIGILYGLKLARAPGESPGAFHFSLGYTF